MTSDDGEKAGLGAALDGVDPGEPPVAEVVQEALFEEPTPLGPSVRSPDPDGQRARGRPRGSKNKRTEAWQDYILGRHQSPLVVLAETYSRPVEELAAELGCNRLEAFKMQILAARELAPYLHQKQPTALNVSAAPLAPIYLAVDPETARAVGVDLDASAIEIPTLEYVENQKVSDTASEKSNDAKSNDEG